MKLAFCLFNYFPFGGLERDFMAISRECLKRGHHIDVFTMKWQGEIPEVEFFSVKLVETRGISNHRRALSFVNALQSCLDPAKYDIVVGFNRMPGLDIYYAADVCYVDRIYHQRSFLSRLTFRYRLFSAYEKAVFSPDATTQIIYLSEVEKQIYQKYYQTQKDRFYYAPPGVDRKRIQVFANEKNRQAIRRELAVEEDDIFLLMIGSNFRTKGVDRAIWAIAALSPKLQRRTYLFIIGKGKEKKYWKQAQQLGISENVKFLGGRHDVPRFLVGADFVLQPSRTENTGNAIVEGLVAGIPVLATASCGYAEHVSRAQAGKIISDPFCQEEMNSLLEDMLSSPERGNWIKNAQNYAAKTDLYHRPEVVADIFEQIEAVDNG
jgi:UDP-glucose:(heptosyl)LPS alpha-1,3-glucosyltransferase